MKRFLLLLPLCLALLLSACAEAQEVETAIGKCTVSQDFVASIEANSGETITADAGNILLVITLKPAEGVVMDLDKADDYFLSGTKVNLAGQSYDLTGIAYERNNAGDTVIKCRLIFEVKDNNYADAAEKPQPELVLPSAAA